MWTSFWCYFGKIKPFWVIFNHFKFSILLVICPKFECSAPLQIGLLLVTFCIFGLFWPKYKCGQLWALLSQSLQNKPQPIKVATFIWQIGKSSSQWVFLTDLTWWQIKANFETPVQICFSDLETGLMKNWEAFWSVFPCMYLSVARNLYFTSIIGLGFFQPFES